MRRHALTSGGRPDRGRVGEVAEEHFGLPVSRLGYWSKNELAPPWRPVA
jgi:hypothetical protein